MTADEDALLDMILSRTTGAVRVRTTTVRRLPTGQAADGPCRGLVLHEWEWQEGTPNKYRCQRCGDETVSGVGRWFAVLEINGLAVLERGPFTHRDKADKAKAKLNTAIDRSGLGKRVATTPTGRRTCSACGTTMVPHVVSGEVDAYECTVCAARGTP